MHAIYRSTFNAVDLFNREAFGPMSVQYAVRTKSWYRRYFLALLGMTETNAMFAYRKVKGEITRYAWLSALSDKLIHNPWVHELPPGVPETDPRDWGEHDNLFYREHHMACAKCNRRTHWACRCGKPLCNAGVSARQERGPCYFEHLRDEVFFHAESSE